MNDQSTPSILQRVPVILAVTAASYGLPAQAHGQCSIARTSHVASNAATDLCPEQPTRDAAPVQH
jgi:hypothetical protein